MNAMKSLKMFLLLLALGSNSWAQASTQNDQEKLKILTELDQVALEPGFDSLENPTKAFKRFEELLKDFKANGYSKEEDGKTLVLMASVPLQFGWPPVIERPKGKQAWLSYRKKMIGAGIKLKKKITALLLKEGFPDNLQAAAARGDLKAVKKFLADKVDVNELHSYTGFGAIHYAAMAPKDYEACCSGNINPWVGPMFIEKDKIAVLKLLIKSGADVNLATKNNYKPLGLTHPKDKKLQRPILLKAGATEGGNQLFDKE